MAKRRPQKKASIKVTDPGDFMSAIEKVNKYEEARRALEKSLSELRIPASSMKDPDSLVNQLFDKYFGHANVGFDFDKRRFAYKKK